VVNDYALRQQKEGEPNPDVPAANAFNVHLFPSPTTRDEVRGSDNYYGYQYQNGGSQRHRCEKTFLPDREFSRFRHRDLPFRQLDLGLADEGFNSILNDVVVDLLFLPLRELQVDTEKARNPPNNAQHTGKYNYPQPAGVDADNILVVP
jgi:hypothetical protein